MTRTSHSYYVVMIDYGRAPRNGIGPYGMEAIVDPEITRREVVSRIRSGEYKNVAFIHLITMNDVPQDLTEELMAEAGVLEAA
jgi:hypothetical protein